jgi:hypothetical protein
MADTTKPRRSSKQLNPEAKAFGIITSALEELPTEVVQRTLDHAARMYGFYVVTDLPVIVGDGQSVGEAVSQSRFEPITSPDPHD